jgi:hypothetical protein
MSILHPDFDANGSGEFALVTYIVVASWVARHAANEVTK